MDKEQKTLKSPLSAILDGCDAAKAKAVGEAQKSLAREVLLQIKYIKSDIEDLEHLLKEILK